MTLGDANGLRVALITQGYQTAGGVQTVARWIADRLVDAGHTLAVFDMATSRNDRNSRRIVSPQSWFRGSLLSFDSLESGLVHVGANIVEIEPMRYLPRRELTAALQQFDLIQVVAGGPALALCATRSGRPIVLQVATTVAWERHYRRDRANSISAWWRRMMSTITARLETATLRRMSAVLVENHRMEDHVRAIGVSRVEIAPPGIDIDRFKPGARGWDQTGYLLSVCRLNDQRKGLDRLIRSYAIMADYNPNTPLLVLAGRGHISGDLRELIRSLDLVERTLILSDVPQSDLPSLYRAASVYLQASYEEGLGISVLEAMACGLPVVSTLTAGTSETVVSGLTGWLLPQDSEIERDMAVSVLRILGGDGEAMARAARNRVVSLFSQDRAFSKFADAYDQAIGH